MAGTPYQQEQMHRFAWTKLTEQQIASKLGAAMSGPTSASPLSDALAGSTLKIVTDDGPTLTYRFSSANQASLSENDGGAVDIGYGALKQDHVMFFSHMIPGTQKGYNVVVDERSKLATVIEVWFSGYEDNREVQREVYVGYVDDGGAAPTARHVRTNRAEGKGYYWKQDTGEELLEFYPSTMYTHFVELTRSGGELGFCAPADYIQINDDFYVFTRTECEFSGAFTMYVLDVNRIENVGVRLGFDRADDLEYYAFRSTGEWLGQIAQFEKFGDIAGAVVSPGPDGAAPAKGARRVYRPMDTYDVLTEAETAVAVANPSVFPARVGDGGAQGMAGNGLPPTDFLAGKELTLRWDNGEAFEYRFDDAETLRWRRNGSGGWTEERYQAWESAPGVILFGHLLTGAPKGDGFSIVMDFDEALVTAFHGTVGNRWIANEAVAQTWFGVIEMEGLTPPLYRRHQFTDELVGRAITWNYSTVSGLTSMHLYSTPNTISWIIFGGDGAGGMEWSGPSQQVKIRDELYFTYWLEEACNGTLGTILINLRTMHDSGVGYHCGREHLSMSSVGAHARNAGRFDVARFFQPKARG